MNKEIIENKIYNVIDDVIDENAAKFYSKALFRLSMLEYRIQKQSLRNNITND